MKNVLISAYACEPGRGSEGEIGWSVALELAKTNQVWVITRANNRLVHQIAFEDGSKPASLHFIYFDLPAWMRWYKKGRRLFLVYYYLWQLGSFFAARQLVRSVSIDVVHHLTGGMDWMPSGLAFLRRPFVWGPVGSEEVHPAVLRTLPPRVRAREIVRNVLRGAGRHLDPFVRYTGRRAAIILSHTPEHMPKRYRDKVQPYVQTGIAVSPRFARPKTRWERGEQFTVIYAGELVHWKGAAYALEAFSRFARGKPEMRLIIVGDGPLRRQLEDAAGRAGVEDQVRFCGKLAMDALIDILGTGDVFLYPSYHHGLATIVLQAMVTGLPIVCLEGDAIGRAVGADCGITVPAHGNFVDGLASALERLADDDQARIDLAREAQRRAITEYSYLSLGKRYAAIYAQL
jgi:glycosyltransferase involved in cell wall biosynthesis